MVTSELVSDIMSMSFDLPSSAIEQLKGFIHLCRAKPDLLHKPELAFFKDYLESLGAKLPSPAPPKPEQPKQATPPPAAEETKDDDKPEVRSNCVKLVPSNENTLVTKFVHLY